VLDLLEQPHEPGAARLERQRPEVGAVELEKVERVEKDRIVMSAPVEQLERRHTRRA
jgi:hypothetical protein